MSLDKTIIDSAVDKKYTEFSDAVKTELKAKLSNHSDVKQYANDFDKIQHMKSIFAKINNTGE